MQTRVAYIPPIATVDRTRLCFPMKPLEELYSTLWKLALVAAGVYFAFDLFIRRTPVEVSRETTYLVEPLDKDGLPNYALAIHQNQREGVTPENNAAALMWQAVRPPEVTDEEYALICREIGISPSAKEQLLTDFSGDETKKLLMQWRLASDDGVRRRLDEFEQIEFTAATEKWMTTLHSSPWKREAAPPLASWLDQNQAPLDMLAVAGARPKFYSPSPNVLADHDTAVLNMALPQVELLRKCAYSLSTRATYRIGNGQFADTWKDCMACWRLGDHASSGQVLIDRLVGVATRKMAMRLTVALLQAPDLPVAIARQIHTDLDNVQERVDFVPTLDFAERLQFLDAALRVTKHRPAGGWEMDEIYSLPIEVDANTVLRAGNIWFDRIVKAASNPDREKRASELSGVESDLYAQVDNSEVSLLYSVFKRTKRSSIIANLVMLTMMPSTEATQRSEDHDAANYQLAKLAASLKIYHTDRGEYPKTLESLAPRHHASSTARPLQRRTIHLQAMR